MRPPLRFDMAPYHAHCLAQVDKMFSKDARQLSGATKHDEYASATSSFVEGAVHFWSDAPYIRGGYTSPHALEPTWARAAMEEPHAGRVFFAGACAVRRILCDVQPASVGTQPMYPPTCAYTCAHRGRLQRGGA